MGWISDVYKIAKDIIGGIGDDDDKDKNGDLWSDDESGGHSGSPSLSATGGDPSQGVSVIGNLGGSALQAGGSVLSGALGYLGQKGANVSNARQAAAQMAFQEQMSSTAYQRSTRDMQAAGLNPMLAYQQGGASAPQGAQAHIESETAPAMASAMQAAKTVSELQNLTAQTQNTYSQSNLANESANQVVANTDLTGAIAAKTRAETLRNLPATAAQAEAATKEILARLPGTHADSRVSVGTVGSRIQRAAGESTRAAWEGRLSGLQYERDKVKTNAFEKASGLADYAASGYSTARRAFDELPPFIRPKSRGGAGGYWD